MGRPSLGSSYRRLLAASAASNLADGVFIVALPLLTGLVAETAGLRTAFAVSAVLNATVLLGRFVVTDRAMADAETGTGRAA